MDIVVENIPQTEPMAPQSVVTADPVAHLSIARHFDIDVPTKEEDGKLQEIWQHGLGLSNSGDMQDTIWQIIHLERTLGAPKLGESRLDKLYRWAKLKRQQANIEEELKYV